MKYSLAVLCDHGILYSPPRAGPGAQYDALGLRTAQQPEPERRRPSRKRFALQLKLFANGLVTVTAARPVAKQLLLVTLLVSAAFPVPFDGC